LRDDSGTDATDLPEIYARRFPETDTRRREAIWVELARFLQRFVSADSRVLDIACDRGDFINNITAGERWAVDIRDVRAYLDPVVQFAQGNGLELRGNLAAASFDVIFMSNYLEHLPSAASVLEQFRVVRDLLKPGGRVIVLQPNIRLVGGAYWDFLDHKTPLTEKSLEEAGQTAGLETVELITRFLPYTTKSRIPQHRFLVRAYLAFRPAWMLLGRQTLYVAARPAVPTVRL
jgi:SAM-dependent methyltransferase